jgi:predicted acetyltransferase
MEKLKLIVLDKRYKQEWLNYINEFDNNDFSSVPAGLYYQDKSFEEMSTINNNYAKGIPHIEANIMTNTYWLLREDDNKLIGVINIRYSIENDYYLYNIGGHIGYEIRPSERKKGYGTKILQLGLEKCKELGLRHLLVVCLETNIGSKKVIEKNNGIFESKIIDNTGNIYLRYWIHI